MNPSSLKVRLKEKAQTLGLDALGIAAPDPSDHLTFYRWWLDAGYQGGMAYLAGEESVGRRAALDRTLPGIRSVAVVADHYPAEDAPGVPEDPAVGVIARYARGRDYHKVLSGKLRALARWLDQEAKHAADGGGPFPSKDPPGGDGSAGAVHRHRVYVDTGPILERDLARRAGLGWFGRNTMLIHPGRGSYFFLGVLLTTMELEPDPPFDTDRCGSCTACLDACPTGALLGRNAQGAPVLDARACISYLTIENRKEIPEELRAPVGNRVFGCDICQEVCPWNHRFAAASGEPGYAARGPGESPTGVEPRGGSHRLHTATAGGAEPSHPGTETASLVGLLETALEEDRWEAFSRGSALRRTGRVGFARNVCVSLGNWLSGLSDPPPEAVAVLRRALEEGGAQVREHAGWALAQIPE